MAVLKIKRSDPSTPTLVGGPASLSAGEMAYNVNTNSLFIGDANNSTPSTVLTISDEDSVLAPGSNLGEHFSISDGTNTIKVYAPQNLSADTVMKFVKEIPTVFADKILGVDSTGQWKFIPSSIDTLIEFSDDIDDDEAVTNNSLLNYDTGDGEWKFIGEVEFKDLLQVGASSNAEFNNMLVTQNLIVKNTTELDVSDVVIKDKVVPVGIKGGIQECIITIASSVATVTGVDATNLAQGSRVWIDGNSDVNITSGVYVISTSNNTNGFTFGTADSNVAATNMFCSLEAVNDAGIDEAGFYLAGANEKKLEWKDNGAANPYFNITPDNISISGESLYMEDVQVINASTEVLHSKVEVPVDSLENFGLDGGEYD